MKYAVASVRVVRFGPFEVDLRAGQLRKNGLKVKLQDQPFQILIMLLEHAGDVVTREELHQRLWPTDTFTDFDHGLNNAINRLREALCDSTNKPRYLETLPRRGYRFIAPVHSGAGVAPSGATEPIAVEPLVAGLVSDPGHPQGAPLPKGDVEAIPGGVIGKPRPVVGVRHGVPLRVTALLAMLLVGIAAGWFVWHRTWPPSARVAAAPIESLAVLPLENLSGDKDQEYFADGMTDELITDLGKIGALRVISRTSIMRYKGSGKSLAEIARELSVDVVVEGTVLRSLDRVRITAQLIHAATDRHLWAESYERDLRDVIALQGEVATAIARHIQVRLTPQEQARLASARPISPQAHEAYLRGRYFFNKRDSEGLKKSVEYLQQAIDIDPRYGLAYAGLADVYDILGGHELVAPAEAFSKAKAAGRAALEIDDTLAEAHTALALAASMFDFDWLAADRGFKRAFELNPNYATAHEWYGEHLLNIGHAEAAIVEEERARELDPLSLIVNYSLGRAHIYARHHDRGIEQCRKTLELDPNFAPAHWCIGLGYAGKEMYEQAIAEFHNAQALGEGPPALGALGYAYGRAGHTKQARTVLRQLTKPSQREYPSPYEIALVYAGLGEKERAFQWLNRAYQERDLMPLIDPLLDKLRPDARFQDLMRRVSLPP